VPTAWVLFFLDGDEHLPSLVILPRDTLGSLPPLQLLELLLPKTVVARPIFSTLRIIMTLVGRARPDGHPGQAR